MDAKRNTLFDVLLLIALTSALIWPLFSLEYLANWGSIESTFIADARMLIAHFPHPAWQPLWYCGTRFDFIYPPALRYGTAVIAMLGHVSTARAYHIYTAVFYVAGIVAVYAMVRIGARSRVAALCTAAASALLSPSFCFLTLIRHDSPFWIPQRLHVLMQYGEGPHISALAVLPAALGLSFLALRKWNLVALGGTAMLCALVVSNNFYGATSLALLFPLIVWAVWLSERQSAVLLRAVLIPLLAWGLCAFWLTPAYVRITIVNLQWVSQPGNLWSKAVALIAAALYCGMCWRFANRKPERAWTVFVVGATLFLSLDVIGFYTLGFRIAGEPPRLVPELDLALILLGGEAARLAWRYPRMRLPIVLVVLLAFLPSFRYLRHAWTPFPSAEAPQQSYEYRIADWADRNLHGERVLPSGSGRFWFDAWADNSQMEGGSEQGMINQILPVANWQIRNGARADTAVLWLQALGTDAVIVPDKTSLDFYRDYTVPEKFRGVVPALFDDGHGTVIYRIPRLYPDIARVVDSRAIRSLGTVKGGDDIATLTSYVRLVEDPTQSRSTVTWVGTDEAQIVTKPAPGQSLLFQETYDPDWRACAGGKSLSIHPDPAMGFMLIDVPPGGRSVTMRFENFRSCEDTR